MEDGWSQPNIPFFLLKSLTICSRKFFLKIVVNQASVTYFPVIGSPTILTFRYWACIVTHTCSYDFVDTHAFGKLWPEPDHYEPIFVTGTSSPEGTKLFC
jgi:hypothetical protein